MYLFITVYKCSWHPLYLYWKGRLLFMMYCGIYLRLDNRTTKIQEAPFTTSISPRMKLLRQVKLKHEPASYGGVSYWTTKRLLTHNWCLPLCNLLLTDNSPLEVNVMLYSNFITPPPLGLLLILVLLRYIYLE